jgi:hypothetical protein
MHMSKYFLLPVVLVLICASPALARMSTQLGFGYGKDIRGDKNLEQYELTWTESLSYSTTFWNDWKVSTAIELSWALLKESGANHSGTARLFLMPQMVLSPNDMFDFILGFGSGFMIGGTDFPDHDLGGSFFIASKVGLQLMIGKHWGVESVYYHQSNAGLYDSNASLNMIHLAFSRKF